MEGHISKSLNSPTKPVLLRKDKRGCEDRGREIKLNYNCIQPTVYPI